MLFAALLSPNLHTMNDALHSVSRLWVDAVMFSALQPSECQALVEACSVGSVVRNCTGIKAPESSAHHVTRNHKPISTSQTSALEHGPGPHKRHVAFISSLLVPVTLAIVLDHVDWADLNSSRDRASEPYQVVGVISSERLPVRRNAKMSQPR